MTNNDLTQLRQQLDTLDAEIAKLLDTRMKVTDVIGTYKAEQDLHHIDLAREQNVIQGMKKYISHPILKEAITDIYQQVFNTSRATHVMKKNPEMPFQRVGIIGLGLIGGSIAKALKAKNTSTKIHTLKRESENNALAKEQGYLDMEYETWHLLLQNVDLVILTSSIDSIPEMAYEINRHSERSEESRDPSALPQDDKLLVMDIASVKDAITETFEELSTERVEFIPTHPMAGSDQSGFEHAKATMFIGRPWVVTPHAKNDAETIEKMNQLILYLGSNPLTMDAAKHDENAAVISHLMFIMATYLYAFPAEKYAEAIKMAGSGFESITRLASGSSQMHTQIYQQNKENIEKAMTEFIEFMKENNLTEESVREFFEKYKEHRDQLLSKTL